MRTLIIAFLLSTFLASAQQKQLAFTHVEPPFWWTGMKDREVQILFHKDNADISSYSVDVQYPGVELRSVRRVTNPHYLFVTISIAEHAKPGKVPFNFRSGRRVIKTDYELRQKSQDTNRIKGFNSSDVLYLIMPDRFANGDPSNDSIPGMYEGVHRSRPGARHGGDLKGISDHLDYIEDLGVTALWLNPVLENNQRRASYHGYAITDLYQVDRRFGGNTAYLHLIHRCHEKNLKVIQDMVMNHIGDEHWLMKDLPDRNWIHQFPEFTRSNYRSSVRSDPYASRYDHARMNDGWFDTTMPDVNQEDSLFATYLIQNTLWWIEYAGIDGIRMDTYPYPDKHFMARWAKRVKEEFPSFNIVGEVWIDDVAATAYWQHGMKNSDSYESWLPAVTDFPFFFAVSRALNEEPGWESGMMRLYTLLSKDFIYPDANSNVTFLDNHDVSRFFLLCGKDLRKYKQGMTFLLTTRGIPQLYYGTELLMDGDGAHHPEVRRDFPGGWRDDERNAFISSGRTEMEEEAFQFLRKLVQWRKTQPAIHGGKLVHYVPENNIYVYFREGEDKTIMVALNGNDTVSELSMDRFAENIKSMVSARDVLNNQTIKKTEMLRLAPYGTLVLEWDNDK